MMTPITCIHFFRLYPNAFARRFVGAEFWRKIRAGNWCCWICILFNGHPNGRSIWYSNKSEPIGDIRSNNWFCIFIGGLRAIIVMRVLMGAFQGPLFPSVIQLLAVWVPATERGFLTALAYSGSNVRLWRCPKISDSHIMLLYFQIGSVITSYFSGIIMQYYSWHVVFYVFGGIAVIWFIIFVSDYPISSLILNNVSFSFLLDSVSYALIIPQRIHTYRKAKRIIYYANWASWNVTNDNRPHRGVKYSLANRLSLLS